MHRTAIGDFSPKISRHYTSKLLHLAKKRRRETELNNIESFNKTPPYTPSLGYTIDYGSTIDPILCVYTDGIDRFAIVDEFFFDGPPVVEPVQIILGVL